MTGIRRIGIAAALAAGCLLLAERRGHAYPQWQLSGGVTRCNQCHVAPTGGGLLNGGGRHAVGRKLSTFAGDGALLYGAATLPSWLDLGVDLRSGYASTILEDGSRTTPQAALPAEAEAQALVSAGGFALYGTLGMRGQLVSRDDAIVPSQNYQPTRDAWLVSREHWLTWRQRQGLYLRAGRFFAPFGLQLAEHAAYVRRELGFNELEESYNLSGGFVSDGWELHLTAFAPDRLRHFGGQETGATAYFERRFGDGAGAWGTEAKYAARAGVTRAIGGGVAKLYVAPIRTLFLAEADAVLLAVDGLRARGQALAAAQATVFLVRGLRLSALGERFQEDVDVAGAARDAGTLSIGWLPYPHIEGQVMARAELPVGGTATTLIFAQLHYFL